MKLTVLVLFSLFMVPAAHGQATLVYQGATVRAEVPTLGPGWYRGEFAQATLRGSTCLGVAVRLQGATGPPSLILLKGVKRLEVDRRTNLDARVLGLGEPAPEDWEAVDLTALRTHDAACPVQGAPGS